MRPKWMRVRKSEWVCKWTSESARPDSITACMVICRRGKGMSFQNHTPLSASHERMPQESCHMWAENRKEFQESFQLFNKVIYWLILIELLKNILKFPENMSTTKFCTRKIQIQKNLHWCILRRLLLRYWNSSDKSTMIGALHPAENQTGGIKIMVEIKMNLDNITTFR